MRSYPNSDATMAHVNLMADTIIANLPEEGLRSVLRSMLAADPSITTLFEERTRVYLAKSTIFSEASLLATNDGRIDSTLEFHRRQQRIRAMLGCGMCYESIPLLSSIVREASAVKLDTVDVSLAQALSTVDGDIIQAITAIQKTLSTSHGSRSLNPDYQPAISDLYGALTQNGQSLSRDARHFAFERALAAFRASSLVPKINPSPSDNQSRSIPVPPLPQGTETFQLDKVQLPRLFSGLWQLSSPSWGSASLQQIQKQFEACVSKGFTAFDMADHYGDAEVIFGKFRSSCFNPSALFAATKYCIFTPTDVTREVVQANVTERCQRMSAIHIDLLQFHWQFYSDLQYITALQYLQEDPRVHRIGLCNFDTQRMEEIVKAGIKVHTNQVQFSLIDSRPTFKMGQACLKHNIKLLTYGTLLGGFLSEKWLHQPEPELFAGDVTPSQRKYYEMILNWGGWALFQELLRSLQTLATKHNVSISNVATRWVLDFPYVGAVIVGTRWGVSDNAEDNLRTYGFRLDEEDRGAIEIVLVKSKREKLIDLLGDCGGEYR